VTPDAPTRPAAPARPDPGHRGGLWGWAVRNWGLTGAFLALLFLTSQVLLAPARGRQQLSEAELAAKAREAILLERAKAEVDAVMRLVIGMSSRPVGVESNHLYFGSWDGSTIALNTTKAPGGTLLLVAAAHECVHAMLDEGQLITTDPTVRHRVVEETTATVLGTFLASRVLTRRAQDGGAFLAAELVRFRQHCLVSGWRADGSHLDAFFKGPGTLSSEQRLLQTIYFPPLALADDVIQICRESSDPWDVLRTISRKYELNSAMGPSL
jgi:hypothetical protein